MSDEREPGYGVYLPDRVVGVEPPDHWSKQMTDPIQDYIREVRSRLDANTKHANELQFAVNDKIKLIGQAAVLHIVLKDRCTDLDKLLRALEVAMQTIKDSANFYACNEATEKITRILRE